MQKTMKEFFAIYGRELDDLPMIQKSATGVNESVTFKCGIYAQFMRGRHRGVSPTWLPQEAKEVNKLIGATIFTPDTCRFLIVEPNNENNIMFHQRGEIGVLWVIPQVDKIVDFILKGICSIFGSYSYVGYSFITSFCVLGDTETLEKEETFPELTSVSAVPDEFKKRLEDDFGYIETALNPSYLPLLFKSLGYDYMGYDEVAHYFVNEKTEVLRMSFVRNEKVEALQGTLSLSARKLIDDCETKRI